MLADVCTPSRKQDATGEVETKTGADPSIGAG